MVSPLFCLLGSGGSGGGVFVQVEFLTSILSLHTRYFGALAQIPENEGEQGGDMVKVEIVQEGGCVMVIEEARAVEGGGQEGCILFPFTGLRVYGPAWMVVVKEGPQMLGGGGGGNVRELGSLLASGLGEGGVAKVQMAPGEGEGCAFLSLSHTQVRACKTPHL